ncbi:MAG: hypothetical protein ACJ76B_11850 [Solirubrobacterales bacterium]
MKKFLCCAALLPCVLFPAIAEARVGQPDRDFGRAGKVTELLAPRPIVGTEFMALAWGGRGTIVATVANRLIEYGPGGERNRAFGRNGVVLVVAPDGTAPEVHGLAVDSRRRILVAGTLPGGLFVARYLPDGRPDRSFGEAGSVVSDLGLPPPTSPPPVPGWPIPAPTSPIPIIQATGLAVDPADRPVLTGSWQQSYQFCYFNSWNARSVGFIARFERNGSPDPTFDSDGLRLSPEREGDFHPMVDGSDVLVDGEDRACLRGSSSDPTLTSLTAAGSADEDFGVGGTVEPPFFERPKLALDRFGRKVLVGPADGDGAIRLLRLTRRGFVDNRFAGGKGIPLYFDQAPALAVDRQGHIYLAAGEKIGEERWDLILARRLPEGRRDRGFGRAGQAFIRFNGVVSPAQILVGDSGKILVGATFRHGKSSGIALARFLG